MTQGQMQGLKQQQQVKEKPPSSPRMSLNPPQRRVSPLMTTTTLYGSSSNNDNNNNIINNNSLNESMASSSGEDDSMDISRLPSMDSSFAMSEAGSWVCPQCSYFNVDGHNEKCAMCGIKDQENNKSKKKTRKYSWLSRGGTNLMSTALWQEKEEEEEDPDNSPPPQEQRPSVSRNSSDSSGNRRVPLKRPGREEDDDDQEMQPAKPRSYQTAKSNSASAASLNSSILESADRNNSLLNKIPREQARNSPDFSSETTSHSGATVKMSNWQQPRPATPPSSSFLTALDTSDSQDTPPRSNVTTRDVTAMDSERTGSAPPSQASSNNNINTSQALPTLPTLRPHSDASAHRSSSNNNRGGTPIFTVREDLEQSSSYLPASMTANMRQSQTIPRSLVPPVRKDSLPATTSQQQHKDVSQHTVETQPSSFTSTSYFEDDISVEVDIMERMEIVEQGQVVRHETDSVPTNTANEASWKRKSLFVCLPAAGIIIVAVVVILAIVFLGAGKSDTESRVQPGVDVTATQPAPVPSPDSTKAPSPMPSNMQLDELASEEGEYLNHLGTSVSVGGPNGNYIAMAADNFVRVMEYLPGEEALQSIGLDIPLSTRGAGQVALSQTMPLKVAIASGGQLSIWHWKENEKEWQVGLNNTEIMFQEDIPTSCAISGNGMVAAAGVIIHDTRPSSATVQIFVYNSSSVSMLSYSWKKESLSISIPDVEESQNTIRVALSYGGDVLAILTDNSVHLKKRDDQKTDKSTGSWSDLGDQSETNLSGFLAMALSGDGSTLALTRQQETYVFIYNDSKNKWEEANIKLSGGVDVSLNHAGDIVAIGNPNATTVSLWHQTTNSQVPYHEYRVVDQTDGDAQSEFGASVAMAQNSTTGESGLLLALGAPMEGEQQGSVYVYGNR